jgi:ureidoacrylate peracid hydrolase
MDMEKMGPDISKSALIIVDMQNDFVHPDGGFGHLARENPAIDLPFLMGTLPYVRRLADAFRKAGRPVIYVAHVLKSDYSDAQFPYWRLPNPSNGNRTFVVEGTWGAQIVDDLKPQEDEHLCHQERLRWILKHPTRHDPPKYGRDDLRRDGSYHMRLRLDDRARWGGA